MKIDNTLLRLLGFKRTNVPTRVSGDDKPFSYWCLDIGSLALITNASDEVVDGAWKVYLFNSEDFEFTDGISLTEFIGICNRTLKK